MKKLTLSILRLMSYFLPCLVLPDFAADILKPLISMNIVDFMVEGKTNAVIMIAILGCLLFGTLSLAVLATMQWARKVCEYAFKWSKLTNQHSEHNENMICEYILKQPALTIVLVHLMTVIGYYLTLIPATSYSIEKYFELGNVYTSFNINFSILYVIFCVIIVLRHTVHTPFNSIKASVAPQ